MNRLLFILCTLIFFIIGSVAISVPAQAVACGVGGGNCFVVPAGGNSNATATWSLTSGGVTCACTPAATDFVILDSAAGQLTLNANFSVASIDASGTGGSGSPYTNTLTQNGSITLTISGTLFKLVAGMTYSAASSSRIVTFTSTSGTTTITTAGKTLPTVTFNGAGGTFQLQDALTFRSDSALTRTAGSFDGNGQAITGGSIVLTCGTTGTITAGTATWTVQNVALTVFDASGATCTFTPTGLTVVASNVAANTSARTLSLGSSKTYAGLTLVNGSTSNDYTTDLTWATAVTIGTFSITAPINIRVTSGAGMTVTNAVAWAGTAYNSAIQFGASSAWTLTLSAAGTCAWCALGNVTVATSTLTATNSFDLGGNTGTISISGPSSGGGRIISGSLLRRDLGYVNDNRPMFIDTAI